MLFIYNYIEKVFNYKKYKTLKKIAVHYKSALLTYALEFSHLNKAKIKQMMEDDEFLSKKEIYHIIKLGSKKVASYLNKGG